MTEKPRSPAPNDFTQAVIASLLKRSKAIRYRGALLEWVRVKEIRDGIESEIQRIDVDITHRVEMSRFLLRLIVWGDRWVWIDVRRSSKAGWMWSCTTEGRFAATDSGAPGLVRKIEETLDATWEAAEQVPGLIKGIWAGSLAQGPKRL